MPPSLIALIPITLIGLWLVAAVLADEELTPTKSWRQTLRQLPHAATWAVLVFALVCGGLALWLGWLGFSEQTKEELYVNLATSLGSIAITVLVIDQLNRWRMETERKREIIEQMSSPVNDAALEAVRLARKYGWLTDGSLKGANLVNANLEGADLEWANLQDARLGGANLKRANLSHAIFAGADLVVARLPGARLDYCTFAGAHMVGASLIDSISTFADFSGAMLGGAQLTGARMFDAILQNADFWAASLEGVELEGSLYDGKTKWPNDFDPEAAGATSMETG